jgi:hypothetical protein
MPPHVSYELTPLGGTLMQATAPLIERSARILGRIAESRAAYDNPPDRLFAVARRALGRHKRGVASK